MDRQFLISNNLDDLEATQDELVQRGFDERQLHVLSNDDAGVELHHLHAVDSFSKTDIVHSTIRGALIGSCLAAFALSIPSVIGVDSDLGWTPFIFTAIIALGFSAWEGGLWGIQEMNHKFKAFEGVLNSGQHILIVDYADFQKDTLKQVVNHHPSLQAA